jgi:hypothetical protein
VKTYKKTGRELTQEVVVTQGWVQYPEEEFVELFRKTTQEDREYKTLSMAVERY